MTAIRMEERTELDRPGRSGAPSNEQRTRLEDKVHQRLMHNINPVDLVKLDKAAMMREIAGVLYEIITEENMALPNSARERIVSDVVDEILGYGPIQPLLDDPTISEVMVNGPRHVYVERAGKIVLTDKVFRDDGHIMRIIERIVAPLGRRIDESSPMVDARLPDGSRVNAIIPPLALRGPTLTIRKFSRDPLTVDDLVRFGTLSQAMADFLRACVMARMNIIVSGGTGSGKTTTLNVLSSFIPDDERILTIEDAAELQLQQQHVVSLESRPPNVEGRGEVNIRMLVRNSLRMRPDRIIVGEVRGGEALDMLQAMNTGHDGSLSTAHTNSPRDTISRIETMVLMAGMELPAKAIGEQIAAAIDVIVHQSRLRDGSRKITHITEVQGMESDVIVLQDIFRFEQKGVDAQGKVLGELRATGLRPKLMERLSQQGQTVDPSVFDPGGSG